MGAGDYWQLMSNGNKGWFKVTRLDDTPVGRINFDTSIATPIGGNLLTNGSSLSRTEYPWLWDHAQQSGLLVDEASRTGMEGCFTKGDGATTFRLPEIRGEFIRAADNVRGIDTGRVTGSAQAYAKEKITGEIGLIDGGPTVVSGVFKKDSTNTISHVTSNTSGAHPKILFDSSLVVNSAEETRPRNIAYPAYIKII